MGNQRRGFLLFAHDNGLVDYAGLAVLCGLRLRRSIPDKPVVLVTDTQTKAGLSRFSGRIESTFDDLIVLDDPETNNYRHYIDQNGQFERAAFHNESRRKAFWLSPFEETVLVDLDYLVFEDSLDQVWNTRGWSVRMNRFHRSVYGPRNVNQTRLHDLGIPQHWATVLYFRKDRIGERFFQLWEHFSQHYDWFGHVYRYHAGPDQMFRNDFAVSMATHVLNDYSERPLRVGPLPNPELLFVWDHDRSIGYHRDGLILSCATEGIRIPVRVSGQSLHVLNKRGLLDHLDDLIELWGAE